MRRLGILALLAGVAFAPMAQAQVHIPAGNPQTNAQPVFCVDPTSGVPAACATGSSTSTPFTPISPSVTATATNPTSNVQITGGGTVLEVTNQGANPVYAALGTSNAVTASATSPIVVPAGATVPVNIGANTWLAVFATTGSNTVLAVSGTGTGYAVGGGGSTIANPLPVNGVVPSGATVVSAAGSSSTIASPITLLAAPGVSLRNYVLAVQCSNTSATNLTVTLNDTAATQFIVPQTFGNNVAIPQGTYLHMALNTALTATLSADASSVFCSAQGYTNP